MALSSAFSELEKFLDQYREFKDREAALELYFSVREFFEYL